MILLVSGATATLRRLQGHPSLGVLITPMASNAIAPVLVGRWTWACDNSAYSNFSPARFCRMLARVAGKPGCLFVTAPDVVGDSKATLQRFNIWQPVLAELSLPVAYVGQDGAELLDLPWGRISALFIGGSTDWKESQSVRDLAQEARRRGKWVHVGRVNTRRRLEIAHRFGAHSVDGTSFSRWPDDKIPRAIRWIKEVTGTAARPQDQLALQAEGQVPPALLAIPSSV